MPPWADFVTQWGTLIVLLGAVIAIIAPPGQRFMKRWVGITDRESVNVWAPFDSAEDLRDHVVDRVGDIKAELKTQIAELKAEMKAEFESVEELENTIKNGLSDRMVVIEGKVDRLVEGQARMEGRMGRAD